MKHEDSQSMAQRKCPWGETKLKLDQSALYLIIHLNQMRASYKLDDNNHFLL